MRISANNLKLLLPMLLGLMLLSACASAEGPASLPSLDQNQPSPEQISTQTSETLPAATESATNLPEPSPSPEDLSTPPPTNIPAAQIPDGDFRVWTKVAQGFSQPLFVTHANDGSNRLFIVDQPGRIWLIENGEVAATPFLDIRGRVNDQSNEQGLLGLAFHPDYSDNGYFFVNYTNSSADTIVSRFSVSDESNLADSSSEEIILEVAQPYSNHNGGHLEFGPDGYLYIAMGDGGSAGDPRNNGQNPNTLLGTLLRIDIDSETPYAIPADNPYADGGGAPEIWITGLRNPWRFSFDSLSGDLYIGDVGQNQWEEINYLPGGVVGGVNFGWNYFEANHAYSGSPPANISLFPPIAEYDHSNGRCSVTGGVVYRGSKLPELWGVYFYGDFCSGEVFALVQEEDGIWTSASVYNLPLLITSFGVDESGEIYLLDRSGDLYNLQ
jgi:glucose/arabinose dehydrogenase